MVPTVNYRETGTCVCVCAYVCICINIFCVCGVLMLVPLMLVPVELLKNPKSFSIFGTEQRRCESKFRKRKIPQFRTMMLLLCGYFKGVCPYCFAIRRISIEWSCSRAEFSGVLLNIEMLLVSNCWRLYSEHLTSWQVDRRNIFFRFHPELHNPELQQILHWVHWTTLAGVNSS